ncbi:hypothetical protein ACIGB8_29155 [Promicromonospora sukumoe]|uniref:hypothetical protein n=1 Tax=Promicromonospora sukumoe TaxID=88382 RepID=UPI0037CA21E1
MVVATAAVLASFTPSAAATAESEPVGEAVPASEPGSVEKFKRECPSQTSADGCLLFVSDGVSDRETAALAYSLKHLDGNGIDEYLQGLPAERLASVQKKLDALKESPEAVERATTIGDEGLAGVGGTRPGSGILTTRDFVDYATFGWCNSPGDCTTFQVVTFQMSLEQTFYPEMNLFGDIDSDNGTFQMDELNCEMMRNNQPFFDTVAYDFPNCTPMLFPSTYKQIFVGTWEHEAYPVQGYYMRYTGHIFPRPDINTELEFVWAGQDHFIDLLGSFSWRV